MMGLRVYRRAKRLGELDLFDILKIVVPLITALILLIGTFGRLPVGMQNPFDSVFVFPKKVTIAFAGIMIANSVLMMLSLLSAS